MSWRYTVWSCVGECSSRPGATIEQCETWERADILWDGRWKDAYRLAESLPHAFVDMEQWTDGQLGSGKTVNVFEHIEGGGICKGCFMRSKVTGEPLDPSSRGPAVRQTDGFEFMCEPCQKAFRGGHIRDAASRKADPNPRLYLPVIDTIGL